MATDTATAVAKGIPALVTPYNTSEFHAMVEAVRAHHWASHDQYVVVASELYRSLAKAQGTRGLLGMDVRIAARRVTRHLAHAAGYEIAAAKAAVRSYTLFTELFLNKSSAAPQRGFDLDK